MKSPALEHSTEKRGFGIGWILRRPTGVLSWMIAGFAIALALTVIVLGLFGTEDSGTVLALRMTARWSFLLFWLAYAGGAIARVFGRFQGLARHGRELGLAFASAQLVHLGLIIWLYHIATQPSGAMVFFWVGMLCTYLLALFSMPRARDALGLRLWHIFRTSAVEYIALVFAFDFIFLPLQAGVGKYPLSYLPFGFLLVFGAGLRIVALTSRRLNFVRRRARIISHFIGGQHRERCHLTQSRIMKRRSL